MHGHLPLELPRGAVFAIIGSSAIDMVQCRVMTIMKGLVASQFQQDYKTTH